jgi:rod shape determining protein RodA
MTFIFSSGLLLLFSFFNLLGIRHDLVLPQIIFTIIAIGIAFFAQKIGHHFFKENATSAYWFFVIILILTFIVGIEVKGSKRWIDFHFFSFQPSEFFKPFFILFFADFFSRNRRNIDEPSVFLLSLFYFIIPTFIIFKQPDLGNALVYTVIYLSILLSSRTPIRFLVVLLTIIVITAVPGWFVLKDYQRNRVVSFLSPKADVRGTGYNRTQAIITAGSGMFLGKGLGHGTQSQLLFLPENHTDFAFSSLVEQFGFVGGAVVLLCYLLVSITIIRRVMGGYEQGNEDRQFGFLYTVGFFAFFIFQGYVNILMNLGLFPITGIALPFISYGGSSLASLFLGFSLLPR